MQSFTQAASPTPASAPAAGAVPAGAAGAAGAGAFGATEEFGTGWLCCATAKDVPSPKVSAASNTGLARTQSMFLLRSITATINRPFLCCGARFQLQRE